MAKSKGNKNILKTGTFLGSFVLSAFFMVVGLSTVGFVPYYIDGTESPRVAQDRLAYGIGTIESGISLSNLPTLGEEISAPKSLPTRIIIPSVGINLPISNPNTTNVDALDEELKSAVARYPGSALAGENGNMLIFGHSSHLPVVYNQMYKAFNALPELKAGDMVTIESADYIYTYQVTEVRKTDATEEYIDLSAEGGAKLTLSTCDNFGAKTSRWVVEATLVASETRAN